MENRNFTEDFSLPVLVDAKTEYTKQLIQILRPYLYEGIQSIYENSKSICKENSENENILLTFQNLLSNIPKWSQEIIEKEYNRIIESSSCDWLEELVTAVILSHTKILTSIRSNKTQKKIKLNIPKIDHFIHKIYIELARSFWKKPYLFNDNFSSIDIQRNMGISEQIIEKCINETIRKQLPVKNILKEYLGQDFNDQEDTDIVSSLSEIQEENLRKLVKKEIDNYKNGKTIIDNEEDDIKLQKNDDLQDGIQIVRNCNENNSIKKEENKVDIQKDKEIEKTLNIETPDTENKLDTQKDKEIEKTLNIETHDTENKLDTQKDIEIEKTLNIETPDTENKGDIQKDIFKNNNLLENNENLLEKDMVNQIRFTEPQNNLLNNDQLNISNLELPTEYVDYGVNNTNEYSVNKQEVSNEVLQEFNDINRQQHNNLNFFEDAAENEKHLSL